MTRSPLFSRVLISTIRRVPAGLFFISHAFQSKVELLKRFKDQVARRRAGLRIR